MFRRDFLRSVLGLFAAAPLAAFGLAPVRERWVDGQWHILRSVDGLTRVDGKPWKMPWLWGRFAPGGIAEVILTRLNTEVDLDWVRIMQPKDGLGPVVCEMRFKAMDI